MDISAEIAAIQAASQGSELRQPLVGALNKLNSGSLPTVTAADAGKILKVGANGWEIGEKSGYMPVPSASLNISTNNTYDVTNYAEAVVDVQPSGKINITQNGTDIDVANYALADVAVSGGATFVQKTITQNGTYDPAGDNADGYSRVIVNVHYDEPPIGYTKIPYIESTGDKYIETNILSQLSLKINLKFSLYDPNAKGYSALLTAGDPSNGYARYYFGVLSQNNEANFYYRFSNYGWTGTAEVINTSSEHFKYTVDIILSENNLIAIYIDSNLYTGSIVNDIVLGKKLYLLTNPPVFGTESFSECRLYSCEISTQDEVLFHGIPTIENSTNKTGLYDTVSNSFFPLQNNV